jgi:hypothetical protein
MPQEFKIKNGLIVDRGGATITGSIIATGGITGSLLGTATNALTASYLNVGPYTETFGGNLDVVEGYEVYAYNSTTSLNTMYATPSTVFSPTGKNFWVDIAVQTSDGASGDLTIKLFASANRVSQNVLLGTYTITSAAPRTVYKMQRTFFTAAITTYEGNDTSYFVCGANPTTSSNSDGLTIAYDFNNFIGFRSVQYPYLIVAVQPANQYVYRLGPSRITYN